MNIEVQFDSIEEMMGFAAQLVNGQAPVTAAKSTNKVSKKVEEKTPVEETVVTMSEDPVQEETVQEESSQDVPTCTLEEVRAKLTALSRTGKQKEVKAILDSLHAKNVTALDPKDYAAVMKKAGAL